MTETLTPGFVWVRQPGDRIIVAAQYKHQEDFLHYGLQPDHFDTIGFWCKETGCGRRTSYNQFEFKKEKHLTMFLLKWSGNA